MKKAFLPHPAQTLADSMTELFRRNQRKLFRPVKTLRELFPDVVAVHGNMSLTPSELTRDSRRVNPGAVFFAIDGARLDGHAFIPEALSRGAIAVVSERPLPEDFPAVAIQVPSMRHALADAARRFWGMPDKKLTLLGITGTKGKTTTAYLLRHLLQAAELDCGMLSTIENDLGMRPMPASRTTADAVDLASFFAQMRENSCTHTVMEVSSHSLEQGRVQGLGYEVALFTNLTSEHMDYHVDMENYYQAKKKLFSGELGPRPKLAVINLDDPYGQRLHGEICEKVETITFGTLPACDVQVENTQVMRTGSSFTLKLGNRRYAVKTHLVGEHNIMNAAGALAAAYALGISVKDSVAALAEFKGVPGRLERIAQGQKFEVLVDYAHTDESLRCTLEALRKIYTGRIITVFGCGGNRDQTKRARMTNVAMNLSDLTIATADNPRREQLQDIFKMMQSGTVTGKPIEFVESRRVAIERAIAQAHAGDCVLIAGKGHETTQEFADAIVPFDDRQVAREVLRELGHA